MTTMRYLLYSICVISAVSLTIAKDIPYICMGSTAKWFVCNSTSGKTKCLNKLAVCDGTADCPDKSDETSCACIKHTDCPRDYRCHKYRDDGMSECSNCTKGKRFVKDQCQDINECEFTKTEVCSDKESCVNYDGGYACVSCPIGFEPRMHDERLFLRAKEKETKKEQHPIKSLLLCDDVNECAKDNSCDIKEANCVNRVGSYSCNCPPGHAKVDGENVCRAVGEQPLIVVAENHFIEIFDLRSVLPIKNISENQQIIDVTAFNGVVFYATRRQIWEYHVATEYRDVVADLNLDDDIYDRNDEIRQLTVDWINQRIYYLTANSVSVVDLFGRGMKLVQHRNISSIAVDSQARFLFYSERGHVYRLHLDASADSKAEIFAAIPTSSGDSFETMAIDPNLQTVYYIHDRVLYGFEYSGENKNILSTSAPYARIEPFENHIYATYRTNSSGLVILRRTGYTVGLGDDRSNVISFYNSRPRSISILQRAKFPQHESVVSKDCSSCQSDWCFILPGGKSHRCVCDSNETTGQSTDCLSLRFQTLKSKETNEIPLDAKPMSASSLRVPNVAVLGCLSIIPFVLYFSKATLY